MAIAFSTGIAMLLVLAGDLEALADTTVVLLLLAFIGVNTAVLVARRDRVDADHFVVPTPVPILGILVCLALLTQQEGEVFARAGLLLLVCLVLWGINVLVFRREGESAPA